MTNYHLEGLLFLKRLIFFRFYQLNSEYAWSPSDPRSSETASTNSKISKTSLKNNRDSGVSIAEEENNNDQDHSREDEKQNKNNNKFRRNTNNSKFGKNQVISYTNKFQHGYCPSFGNVAYSL